MIEKILQQLQSYSFDVIVLHPNGNYATLIRWGKNQSNHITINVSCHQGIMPHIEYRMRQGFEECEGDISVANEADIAHSIQRIKNLFDSFEHSNDSTNDRNQK